VEKTDSLDISFRSERLPGSASLPPSTPIER
jgi:hypothetical protein